MQLLEIVVWGAREKKILLFEKLLACTRFLNRTRGAARSLNKLNSGTPGRTIFYYPPVFESIERQSKAQP